PARRPSPFAGLKQYAQDMKAMQDDLKSAFGTLGPMIGFYPAESGKPKTIVEQLKEAKGDLATLKELFPESTTGSDQIPIKGEIPAWMVFAPQAIDTGMDAIEKRLLRWGVISPEDVVAGEQEEFIEMPNRPAAAKSGTKKTEEEKTEDIVPKVEIPEKPIVSKEKESKTDKKDEDKKGVGEGGGRREESAKAG
ncbi:unnamed protein product, partial [marine sediment metagenome]